MNYLLLGMTIFLSLYAVGSLISFGIVVFWYLYLPSDQGFFRFILISLLSITCSWIFLGLMIAQIESGITPDEPEGYLNELERIGISDK